MALVARRPRAVHVASALALITAALGARPARANGRFPASSAVLFSPADDAEVVVRVTFGLLVSRDRGRTWGWICERAIGFSGPEDPSYVITRSGAIVAGLFDGLRVSRDGGCSWDAVKTDATVFVDVTTRSDGAILALASSYDRHADGGSLYKTQLWISTDDARSFTAFASRFDPTLLGESVEVAPGDSSRVYVTAVRGDDVGRQAVLLVSTDGGKHWTERATPLEGKELAPFIAAVDPKRADRIYLRTSASTENPTRLLVTDDAGRTYRTLLGAKGPLLGFALAPGGSGFHAGGPDDGLFAGSADGPAATAVSKLKVQCLAQGADALWACSSEASGFVAGASRDGGARFEARLHLRDIAGPATCAAGTSVAKECSADWMKLGRELGIGAVASATTDAGAPGSATVRGASTAPANEVPAEPALARSRGAWMAAVVAAVVAGLVLARARRRRS